MFANIAKWFADQGKTNFSFQVLTAQVDAQELQEIAQDAGRLKQFFGNMLLAKLPTAARTAANLADAFVDSFWLKGCEGFVALLGYMMALDSDNWFQPEAMYQTIKEARVRRSDEQIFVFKGFDNADLAEGVCFVHGQLLCSLNQDNNTATIFIPTLRD